MRPALCEVTSPEVNDTTAFILKFVRVNICLLRSKAAVQVRSLLTKSINQI